MEDGKKKNKDRQSGQEESKRHLVRPEERHYNNGEFIGPNTYKSREMHSQDHQEL